MSWCSSYTKALNFQPKENSKTQQKKREMLSKNPVQYLSCEKCKKSNVTLYKVDEKYYCKEDKP